MNALGRHLAAVIREQGPVTIGYYMAEAMGHPVHGYYTRQDPIGAAGDFITAPEISQTFGELLGLWAAAAWQASGAPVPVRLVELGPGRGTLMADAMRALAVVPRFRDSLKVHLVETSPALRVKQKAALADAHPAWHQSFAEVPDGPLIVIANELFDALPIRQFQRSVEGWHERLVGLDRRGDHFRYVLSPPIPPAGLIPEKLVHAPLSSTIEICPAGQALAAEIAARLQRHGGAALFIDYGAAVSGPRDTFQAVRRHGRHPPLEAPGEADLAAHVDFGALARAAAEAGADIHGPLEQGLLLGRLGIHERAAALARTGGRERREAIASAVARLTEPEQMGSLFKALAIVPHGAPPPPGFET